MLMSRESELPYWSDVCTIPPRPAQCSAIRKPNIPCAMCSPLLLHPMSYRTGRLRISPNPFVCEDVFVHCNNSSSKRRQEPVRSYPISRFILPRGSSPLIRIAAIVHRLPNQWYSASHSPFLCFVCTQGCSNPRNFPQQ